MTGRERAVNEQLLALGEAHRLGQIGRQEYRARRRQLLASLIGSEGSSQAGASDAPAAAAVTERRALIRPVPPAVAAAPPASPKRAWLLWLLMAVALLLLAALALWLLRPAAAPPTAPPAEAVALPQDGQSLEAMATRFVDDDQWQPAGIAAFLAQWQAAEPTARRQALGSEAFQRLRQQLAYQQKVTAVLLDEAVPDSGKAELAEALKQFDQALGRGP